MNKLASLAIVAFLMLGGLMWYAANGSMQQYLIDYQNKVTHQLPTGSDFSLKDIQLASADNQGVLTGIKLTVPTTEDDSSSIIIDSLSWQYEKRSLKKATVIVEYISISSAQFLLPNAQPKQALAELATIIEPMINQAITQQVGLNGRQEFQVTINKVIIENLFITLMNKQTPIEEVIASNLILQPPLLTGESQMSISGARILQTLIEQAEQTLITQGK